MGRTNLSEFQRFVNLNFSLLLPSIDRLCKTFAMFMCNMGQTDRGVQTLNSNTVEQAGPEPVPIPAVTQSGGLRMGADCREVTKIRV